MSRRGTRDRDARAEPPIYLKVRCPECGALPGQGCFDPRRAHLKGGAKIRGWHRARINAYISARERGRA